MVLPMGAIWMAGGVPRPSPGPLVPSVCGGGDGGGEGGGRGGGGGGGGSGKLQLYNLCHKFYENSQSVITNTMG